MKRTESQEMYLKAIYNIGKRKGNVHKIDIAAELGLSKPSVTEAMRRMERHGDVVVDENNVVLLTELGKDKAEKVLKRYAVIEELFRRMDMPQEKIDEVACKLEHAIDDETFYYIKIWLDKQKDA